MWTKIPASCAGRDSGFLWLLLPGMGFSRSSKRKRVFAFPVASSKVRSLTSFFCFGIAAFAASRRSAARLDFSMYFSSSSCAFLAAFLLAFRVWAASIRSMTRSAVPVSCFGAAPGAWGSGEASGEAGNGCAASCAVWFCCSGGFCGSACGCSRGSCRIFCLWGFPCGASVSFFPEKSASCSRLLTRSAVCLVSFTSTSPSRVIFCVILSRGCAHFLRLRRHYLVKLRVLREAVYKGQHHVPIEDKPLTCFGVGNVLHLLRGNA